jgi:anti-sigma factor RsiW
MRCAELEESIVDYADGLADERGRRIVERHIQRCADCRERVLRIRQLAQQLRRLTLLPAGVQERVPRLRVELEQRLSRRLPFFR